MVRDHQHPGQAASCDGATQTGELQRASSTPRHNGKVEGFQRITADEFLYAEVFDSEQERRDRHGIWLHHYNYHRPHTACGYQPPASRLHASVDNVMTNYT